MIALPSANAHVIGFAWDEQGSGDVKFYAMESDPITGSLFSGAAGIILDGGPSIKWTSFLEATPFGLLDSIDGTVFWPGRSENDFSAWLTVTIPNLAAGPHTVTSGGANLLETPVGDPLSIVIGSTMSMPEPGTLGLFALGLAALAARRRTIRQISPMVLKLE